MKESAKWRLQWRRGWGVCRICKLISASSADFDVDFALGSF